MELQTVSSEIIIPTLSRMSEATGKSSLDSLAAEAMLLAIGLQESNFAHRQQVVDGEEKGPAVSYWQFEKNGGVEGVVKHRATAPILQALNYPLDKHILWEQMKTDDVLGCVMARLLLWSDPSPLPTPLYDYRGSAWDTYKRIWRPGKPHPERWAMNWINALKTIAPRVKHDISL